MFSSPGLAEHRGSIKTSSMYCSGQRLKPSTGSAEKIALQLPACHLIAEPIRILKKEEKTQVSLYTFTSYAFFFLAGFLLTDDDLDRTG